MEAINIKRFGIAFGFTSALLLSGMRVCDVDSGERGEHPFFQQPDARHRCHIHHQDRHAVVGDGHGAGGDIYSRMADWRYHCKYLQFWA